MEKDINRVFDFVIEIDKMKSILRRSLTFDGSHREDDAEHSWHLAMMAILFADYAPVKIDLEKVLKMTLVHDLIEIYAGDTFAYDEKANQSKAERERLSADTLFSLCPEAEPLRALWEEFDAENTPESLYAASLDRIQPMLSNHLNEGHTWVQGKVTREQVYKRIEPVRRGLPAAWPYMEAIIRGAIEKGYIR